MALQEEQMLLLEQITYLDNDFFGAIGINTPERTEIFDWLQHYRNGDLTAVDSKDGHILSLNDITDRINNLPNDPYDAKVDGRDWKNIIDAITSDDDIMSLELKEYSYEAKAFCFADKSDNSATFVFQGTGGDRWKDNFLGLYQTDTEAQIQAREFIEKTGSEFDSVDLVGHSKGGNLIQYATITADYSKVNINRCISMDGQGFNKEFLDAYSDQIIQHGGQIKNYCYDGDYVNILLNKVPGSQQIYCSGSAVGIDNHFANSMIDVINTGTEEDPCWNVIWRETERNAGMEYLHGFTCYLANNMPLEERERMGEFIGDLVDHLMNSEDASDVKIQWLIKQIKEKPGYASQIIAYFIKYVDDNNLSNEQVYQLLKAFGLEKETVGGKPIGFWIGIIRDFIIEHPNLSFFTAAAFKAWLKTHGIWNKDAEEIWKYIQLVYGNYKKIDNKEYISGDYVPEDVAVPAIANIVYDATASAISTVRGISNKQIKVDPEILRSQSDELFALYKQFEDLTSEIKVCIDKSDKACSRNMSMQMIGKINVIIADINKMNVLIDSGARAAYTAATSYESIDKALAKQISNL